MESGWYVLGGEVEAFEREWADWCGTSHCVGVSTGLSALELVLRAWELGPGDEVIVPANSYIANWSVDGFTQWQFCQVPLSSP